MAKAKEAAKKAKPKKRDKTYWLPLLKKKDAKIYAVYMAGHISLNKALEAVGLKQRSVGLAALKRVWNKSPVPEQDAFQIWMTTPVGKVAPASLRAIADANRRLTNEVRDFLVCWTYYNQSKMGRIMIELSASYTSSDTRLSNAVERGLPLKQEIIDFLGPWLTSHGYPRFDRKMG